jgi:2-oxoglutarate/2-oxoacid ferredoxin oxidoreductase subunit alpha
MTERRLMHGNGAIAEATVRAGCRFVAGYPLTPSTEILEYLSWRMREVGGVCVQAESELAAMVYGASASGSRAMTPTSGLGLSLMQEGLSQMCAVEMPGVVIDMARMGPGLGTLSPTQADYFLATRGTGHGDGRAIVLAPASVQEAADMTIAAFDLAEAYRNPVLLLGDALLAQVMEPVQFPPMRDRQAPPAWSVPGWRDGAANLIGDYHQDLESVEESIRKLERKYAAIEAQETRAQTIEAEDVEILVVAFGTAARVATEVVREYRASGFRVGLFRPLTLWPFPRRELREAARRARAVLVPEMNLGQMIEDVRLSLGSDLEIVSLNRRVGAFAPDDIRVALQGLFAGRSQ